MLDFRVLLRIIRFTLLQGLDTCLDPFLYQFAQKETPHQVWCGAMLKLRRIVCTRLSANALSHIESVTQLLP